MSCVRRSLLLFVFCVSSLQAHSVVIVQGGTAWYVPDGSSTAIRIGQVDQVIMLDGDGPVDPPPDPTPTPGELQRLSSLWKTTVLSYDERDAHRQGLMALYSVLAAQVDAGKISDIKQLKSQTIVLRDLVLGDDQTKWNVWHKPIGEYLEANVSSLDDAASAYRAIAAGLAEPGEAIGIGWIMVIEFIIGLLGEGTISPGMLALIKALINLLIAGTDVSEIVEALRASQALGR